MSTTTYDAKQKQKQGITQRELYYWILDVQEKLTNPLAKFVRNYKICENQNGQKSPLIKKKL